MPNGLLASAHDIECVPMALARAKRPNSFRRLKSALGVSKGPADVNQGSYHGLVSIEFPFRQTE